MLTFSWTKRDRFSMFDFIKRTFFVFAKTFTIPWPEKVVIATELSSGLGRRLPWYSTSQCVIVVKQEITVPAWNHWQRPEERFPSSVADRLFLGKKKSSWEEVDPRRENCFSTLFLMTGISCLFLWCVYVSEFVSEFHSCPLALRSGHNRKKNLAIGSCGSTNY